MPSPTMPDAQSLSVRGVGVSFAGVAALADVDLDVREGEILGLIGPNGAGKSTLVNVISGYQRPDHGSVVLCGRDVTGRQAHVICRRGLARTFQSVRLFERATVFENVEAAALSSTSSRRRARAATSALIDQMGMTAHAGDVAGDLPYGDQRRLALARALATEPRFLLIDEPAAGLDERETDEMRDAIRRVRGERGCGVLVIEHDMGLIMRLCDRVHVLNGGRTVSVGAPDEVRTDPAVIEAYLGAEPDPSTARRVGEHAVHAEAQRDDDAGDR